MRQSNHISDIVFWQSVGYVITTVHVFVSNHQIIKKWLNWLKFKKKKLTECTLDPNRKKTNYFGGLEDLSPSTTLIFKVSVL